MNIKTIITSIFKVIALVLSLSVLLPTVVKLSHVFNHHEHEVCANDNTDTHFHEIDLDCEFYKFKLNTNYYTDFYTNNTLIQEDYSKIESHFYGYLRTHKNDTSHLRGPPTLA